MDGIPGDLTSSLLSADGATWLEETLEVEEN
jgi:hypothetical protein